MDRTEVVVRRLVQLTMLLLPPLLLRANPTYAVIVPMQSSFWLRDLLRFSTVVPTYFDPYADQSELNKEAIIVEGVFARYDWRIRPKGLNTTIRTGGPVVITTNLYLRTISKIDDVNMEYNTQFTFREMWNDPRLAYGRLLTWTPHDPAPPFILLVPDDPSQRIWMPDTFFQNEKNAQRHMIDKPNVLIRVYSNGDILYSVRLTLTLSCPMSLREYPMDSQMCLIDLASYAYTSDDIVYQWKSDSPIQLKDTVKSSLPSFDLIGTATGYCTSKTATGEYSCLRVELHFQRMFSYYLLQLYIPSFMLVIVSWVSFWVDKSSVPARVTLGVTTLLTITTQASGINAKLPPVSYTKAIDVWIGVCLAFVFGALLEYALVNYAGNETSKKKTKLNATELLVPCCSPTVDRAVSQMAHHGPSTASGRQSPTPLIPHSQPELPGSPPPPQPPSHKANAFEFGKYHQLPSSYSRHGSSCQQWCDHDQQQTTLLPVTMITANSSRMHHKTSRKRGGGSGRAISMIVRFKRWMIALYRDSDRPKKIDVASRILFPTGFLVFNIFYWFWYK